MTQVPRILLVDDSLPARQNIRKALAKEGLDMDEVTDSNGLFSAIQKSSYDVIILDLDLPDFRDKQTLFAGFKCLERLQENSPDIPVIVFSDYDEKFLIREAFSRGAFEYIGKNRRNSQKELVRGVFRAWNERQIRLVKSKKQELIEEESWSISGLPLNRIRDRDLERINQKIEDEYKLLEISEESIRRIRDKRFTETDQKEIIKLEKQERQERQSIEEIEEKIAELRTKLEDLLEGNSNQTGSRGIVESLKSSIKVTKKLHFDVVPIGIYPLLEDIYGLPMVVYEITNQSTIEHSILISTTIARYSDRQTSTISIEPSKTEIVKHSPVLNVQEIYSVKHVLNATLHTVVKVVTDGQEKLVSDSTDRIRLHSRDTAPLRTIDLVTGGTHDLTSLIAAWVTPHTSNIEKILRKAVDYHPQQAIVGYQGGSSSDEGNAEKTRMQIEAIYKTLQTDTQIRYLNSVISFGKKAGEIMQRIRLPDDSLELSVANCIDGAVLFASLIESATMNPVIMLVPGHAFVGWETWDGSNRYEYLETTMTGLHPFSSAWQTGIKRSQEEHKHGNLRSINVVAARKQGILPMA